MIHKYVAILETVPTGSYYESRHAGVQDCHTIHHHQSIYLSQLQEGQGGPVRCLCLFGIGYPTPICYQHFLQQKLSLGRIKKFENSSLFNGETLTFST